MGQGRSASVYANRYPERHKLFPRAKQRIRDGIYHFKYPLHA